ncbi:MAG: RagB/SusD family nutrient uptake outer membrane protein [Bacteroidales bacterium]|nr:RagB/SusD family nutrient uptake outer membrane protein [Bacteroidales bacterium]
MKLKSIIALAVLSFGLISCTEKFFEQYPSNSITEGNFYQTESDFNQGVYACYAKLKTQSGFHITELAHRSDECILRSMAVSTQDRYDIGHFAENSSNAIMKNIWDAWYNGIYRCNDVLDHMPAEVEGKMAQYKAEALFLRSWWYFNLYRCFGGVPIATKVETPADSKLIPRCTEEQMYQRLVEDLTYAAANLPATRSAEVARVTTIAAQALLGKVYLTFGKYAEAEAILAEAMKDTNYGLMTTTADAFDIANKGAKNKEFIFILYYNKSNDNGHGYWYSASTSVKEDIQNPTAEFKAIYDQAKDNRFTLIDDYVKISGSVYAMKKWNDTYDATYTDQVGNDYPHLRYADVVLMYAEALAQQGRVSDACTYLNKTRQRAGLEAYTTSDKAAFIRELAAERGREFALEGQRWFDLVRLGLAEEILGADQNHLVFPIPNAQIEIVNDNSILWQNPGF